MQYVDRVQMYGTKQHNTRHNDFDEPGDSKISHKDAPACQFALSKRPSRHSVCNLYTGARGTDTSHCGCTSCMSMSQHSCSKYQKHQSKHIGNNVFNVSCTSTFAVRNKQLVSSSWIRCIRYDLGIP